MMIGRSSQLVLEAYTYIRRIRYLYVRMIGPFADTTLTMQA